MRLTFLHQDDGVTEVLKLCSNTLIKIKPMLKLFQMRSNSEAVVHHPREAVQVSCQHHWLELN